MTCRACGADTAPGDRFCTACGTRLVPPAPRPAAAASTRPARLVACATCGAMNAASRTTCARCQAPLSRDDPAGAEREGPHGDEREATGGAPRAGPLPPPPPEPAPPPAAAGGGRTGDGRDERSRGSVERPPWAVIGATFAAAVVLLVVLAAFLAPDGVPGPDAGPSPGAVDLVPVDVVTARASSALAATGRLSYGPENLLDGNPITAWNEAAPGSGEGEWVEFVLASSVPVVALEIRNGYQKGAFFVENGRVRTLDIVVGETTFTVRLRDEQRPQEIALPRAVRSRRVRLVVVDVYEGTRYPDAALSEVRILTAR